MLTGAQLRAARGLLNISVTELAERTGLAVNTIRRAESTNGPVAITHGNATLLKTSLEGAGVLFIDPDDLGAGVRLLNTSPLPRTLRRRDATGSGKVKPR